MKIKGLLVTAVFMLVTAIALVGWIREVSGRDAAGMVLIRMCSSLWVSPR